jgi:hypothetical protein
MGAMGEATVKHLKSIHRQREQVYSFLALTWKIQQLGPSQNGELSAYRDDKRLPTPAAYVPFQ